MKKRKLKARGAARQLVARRSNPRDIVPRDGGVVAGGSPGSSWSRASGSIPKPSGPRRKKCASN